MKINRYYLSAIFSFLIWGFLPIPLKAINAFESEVILFFRILFSSIALFLFSFIFRRKELLKSLELFKSSAFEEKKRFLFLTVSGGLLLTLNWFSYIYIINHVSIQTGSFAYLICPILTAISGFIILKESLNLNQWLAIILSFISCMILGMVSLPNLALSLLIALSYAFYIIAQRALKNYDKIFLLNIQLFIALLLVGPYYSLFNVPENVLFDQNFFLIVLLISICFTVLPLFLNLYALKELPSGTIGILMYINPVLNFMIAFVYFQEKTSLLQLIAYFLIFLSVILYNIKFSKISFANDERVKFNFLAKK